MILLSRWGRTDAMESYMFTFPVKSSQHFKDLSEEGITQEGRVTQSEAPHASQ